ncbi:MAG: hydro-lyase, Fe-S type, tartrate/fumarate subfamily, beta subunit [Actinobacteria bacterium]|nr:hydro-lyase, Fe-S type, tartrate/fumarate subfamily, beta subunit [Actinomycetota bacterium]
MPEFHYQEMFERGPDTTVYRALGAEGLAVEEATGRRFLRIDLEVLRHLAAAAVTDVSHLFRTSHLEQLRAILDDPEASDNDRFVAREMLRNAVVSAAMVLPSCQDTGTAIVYARKGEDVHTGGGDEEALSHGVYDAYTGGYLRYSQVAPLTMFEERNTGTNLPAQIDIHAVPGGEYEFLFVTKGGGSANKTLLFQESKAVLNPAALRRFLEEKLRSLGAAACPPPYHLAVVIGGTSAEATLATVKLASCHYLDDLPTTGNEHGRAFRDPEMEQVVLEVARETGIGAQFGGKYFCLDARVVRLPRHGASCPIGIGVSCSADRQIKAKITPDGVFLEQLDTDPARFLPADGTVSLPAPPVPLDLNRPMDEIRATLSKYPVRTRLSLTGPVVVARDIAHARLKERLDRGEGLPQYLKDHIVYYAGPAKTPEGYPSGSFGPTTAGRMDSYVDQFQSQGASLVMLAKGNRSKAVTEACARHGGFYLGSIGGPAALLAQESITRVEVLEYPELGMEAVWKIEVRDFPAFILVDDKGHDFYGSL